MLLDLSFRAKVGDFGLARPLEEDKNARQTVRVVGTSGYIPPEYYRGVITTKMDTFGFGVVRTCCVLCMYVCVCVYIPYSKETVAILITFN